MYFSISSQLPEVREAELAIINESMSEIMKNQNIVTAEDVTEARSSERVGIEREDENLEENSQQHESVSRENIIQEESNDEEVESLSAEGGESIDVVANVERENAAVEKEQLMVVIQQLLKRIQVLEANQTQNIVTKPMNSTQSEEKQNQDKEKGKAQPKPEDFLAWLKTRNSSMLSSRSSENKHKEQEKASSGIDNSEKTKLTGLGGRLPVHKWSIRYDGMDNGRKLNEFLKEVEFNARSEGFSEAELFVCAHHLFTRKARSWFMEVNGCNELETWKNLVAELKNEFLPIDIDYVYERQVNGRKQGSREKFQDYYLDMVRIFRCMTNPWDEKRKFDVLFRNTREDCRIAMLAANITSIPRMKDFGKRFDSINWQLYQRGERYSSRAAQVDEVRTQRPAYQNGGNRFLSANRFQTGNRFQGGNQQNEPNYQQNRQEYNRNNQPRSWQQGQQYRGNGTEERPRIVEKTQQKPNNQQREIPVPGPSGTSALQRIVRAYIPVKRGVCFNCHEGGHGHEECRKELSVFCERCGFPGFPTKDCPYCQSKNDQKTAQ